MPQPHRLLIPLRGSADYDRYLSDLLAAVQARHPEIQTRTDLAALALARLGSRFGLDPPARANPRGTNRFGAPRGAGKKKSG